MHTTKIRNISAGMEKQVSYGIFFISNPQPGLFIWITEDMLYFQSRKQYSQHLPILSHLGTKGQLNISRNNTVSQFGLW